MCLAATGSGKTGLCIGLLESLALRDVPILAIDPKGDLTHLALAGPLDAARLAPWVPDAASMVAGWSAALAAEGREAEAAAFAERVEVTVLTPGSEAGVPVDVLTALTGAPVGLLHDPEGLRGYVIGAVSASRPPTDRRWRCAATGGPLGRLPLRSPAPPPQAVDQLPVERGITTPSAGEGQRRRHAGPSVEPRG